jgi:hypothetical protein
MELTLNSIKIYELGEYVTKFLHDNGLTIENDLVIRVSKENLKKIDEDLYYRNKPDGNEFIPSDSDVVVKFENLNIIFTTEETTSDETK